MTLDTASKVDLVALARSAEASNDYEEAAILWQSAVEQNPTSPFLATRFIAALVKVGRHAEAEVAAAEASERLPDHVAIGLELGWIAARQNDWELALQRWQDVAVRFAEDPSVASTAGKALLHLGRLREADTVFAAASAKFPDDFSIALIRATIPVREGNWAEAVKRLEDLVEKFPEQPIAFAQLGNALRASERIEDARILLSNACRKFQDDPSITIELAKLLEPDWPAALEAWEKLAKNLPDNAVVIAGYGRALRLAGQAAEAEVILEAAQGRFSYHYQTVCEYAALAVSRLDWQEAMRRWGRVVELFPKAEGARNSLASVRWSASVNAILEQPDDELDDKPTPQELRFNFPEAKIFGQFESLGEDCEFGLVQRHYGIEPLGLLRFASVHQTSLIDALGAHFHGVGDPEFTRLNETEKEYLTSDTRYGLGAHTHVSPHSVNRESFLKDQCKRIAFLKRKLLGDLEAAEKIFVVTAHGSSSEEDADILYKALRKFGANHLLYVRAGGVDVEPGSIRKVGDGLVFGYLDQWGNDRQTGRWNISYSTWLTLCQRTLAVSE